MACVALVAHNSCKMHDGPTQLAVRCECQLSTRNKVASKKQTCIKILVRSSGATEVLPQAPAIPPAISSCEQRPCQTCVAAERERGRWYVLTAITWNAMAVLFSNALLRKEASAEQHRSWSSCTSSHGHAVTHSAKSCEAYVGTDISTLHLQLRRVMISASECPCRDLELKSNVARKVRLSSPGDSRVLADANACTF